jgi:hypothetical protein
MMLLALMILAKKELQAQSLYFHKLFQKDKALETRLKHCRLTFKDGGVVVFIRLSKARALRGLFL